MGADDVLEALYPLLLKHGSPEYIQSDNGPEFVAEAMQDWLRRVGIKPIRIYRDHLGKTDTTTEQAQVVINQWLKKYNHTHPIRR